MTALLEVLVAPALVLQHLVLGWPFLTPDTPAVLSADTTPAISLQLRFRDRVTCPFVVHIAFKNIGYVVLSTVKWAVVLSQQYH